MKKLLFAILAGVFAASLSAGAFAADTTHAKKAKHHHNVAVKKEVAAPAEAAK